MRNLNRIIFINSANIPYADDIYLDGNIHFIGTQGVGKSTILRAILFFYNADTQKLGIPVEKQTYTDYYFPYANSYIVYEVKTEHGAFCILSFKSMNRVCYRFIDAAYRKEFFIDENRTAYGSTERIRSVLDQYDIDYSRIIYTYDEYRNILYGSLGNEFKKYALMESKQYQNIPRTIQNVFLNAKLDAEFIKKTIISSLSENETGIDLNSYKEHLKNFETRLQDIEEFQRKETRKQAKEITNLSVQTARIRAEIVHCCQELVAAYRQAEQSQPKWKLQIEQQEAERQGLIRKKQELQEASKLKCGKLQEELAILNSELNKAIAKEKDYQKQHIGQIAERSVKKEELKNKQNALLEEQRILTSQHMEISTKYKSLIQTLDEQWNRIHETKIRQQDEINTQYNGRLEEARKEFQKRTDHVYQEFETLQAELHPLKADKQSELNNLDYLIKLCKKETYFEEEQTALKENIQAYASNHLEKKNAINQAQLTIKELTLNWNEENTRIQTETEAELRTLQKELEQLNERTEKLAVFLENSTNTLQGWLKQHKKGWEDTIGKLCDENLLWQTNLSPALAADGGNSFYGIEIDLGAVERHIKSIDDYICEKEENEQHAEAIRLKMQRLQKEKEATEEQLKRKYQPLVKEQKGNIARLEYELDLLERAYQQNMLDLDTWKKKGEAQRAEKLKALEEKKQQLRMELEELAGRIGSLKKDKDEQLGTLKEAWKQTEQQLYAEKQAAADVIRKEDKEEQQRIAAEKREYEARMQTELHVQGADTERLDVIGKELESIGKELTFIGEHAALLIEYQKDKRDLIDRIPAWQRDQEELKQKLQTEQENLKANASSLQDKIDFLNRELQLAEENNRELSKNLEAYSKISSYDWYKPHQDIFGKEYKTDVSTQKSCIELIDELTRKANQFMQLQSKLRKEVNLFTGHFNEDNTFKFQTKFNEDWEYVRFADQLHDFVEENRIDEYIRRINNEHWDTFKRISMDVSSLTSSEGDIEDIIRQINKGFATCNFVGVIQCIEMKVEESSNRVMNILREIRKYYQTYGYDLAPESNLFSSDKEQLVKEEAIGLLRDFIKEIHTYKYDSIRLYDSFELRFRIVENNNDTGFVEKISNVGSEGTDILVKAMINIMLLNVFKESASRKFKDFKLHCMMDEIGKLHPSNIAGILKFANDRNIILINGSPTELNRDTYKHVYLLTKGAQSKTRIARLISDQSL